MNDIEKTHQFVSSKEDLHAIFYIDQSQDKDLVEFITKTQHQGCNCLDLSKRNIKEFPSQLLAFPTLQYLYLEGNKLTQLPFDLFIRLPNLKWLDLRNNQLTAIPSHGLAKHQSLQYLLLSRNRLRTLPYELGKVKTLSALNLDGNPLDYPPFDIIRQGIRAVQQYLRERLPDDDDLSLSSDEEPRQEETPRLRRQPVYPRKSNSETGYYETPPSKSLPPHLQSCIQYKRVNYSAIRPSSSIRSRPQSELRFTRNNTKTGPMTSNDPPEKDIFITREASLMHMKHRSIKIDDEIDYLRQQSRFTSKDYEEPIVQTPFLMDPRYTSSMKKETQPTTGRYDQRRNQLNEDEEAKRRHDRQIQDRIRQITDRMLRRRLEARSSLFEEKRQVRLELREIRRLESDALKANRLKSQKKSP